nr:MAG TPA: hypothetical protein [Caudoviricetes sp.]
MFIVVFLGGVCPAPRGVRQGRALVVTGPGG